MKNNRRAPILHSAELDRQSGKLRDAQCKIDEASVWVARSGSQELLCLLYLTRGRLLKTQQRNVNARGVLEDTVHIARNCKLALYHIDLMNELAEMAVERNQMTIARDFLLATLNGLLRSTHQPAQTESLPLEDYDIVGANHESCQ